MYKATPGTSEFPISKSIGEYPVEPISVARLVGKICMHHHEALYPKQCTCKVLYPNSYPHPSKMPSSTTHPTTATVACHTSYDVCKAVSSPNTFA